MTRILDTSALRLRAWVEGKPLRHYATGHFRIVDSENALVVAFVRMGGESSPWGIAVGHPDSTPRLFAIPEARNQDLVADMVAEAGPVLLRHFGCPGYAPKTWDPSSLRQIWVSNGTHIEMLHCIAYRYLKTKYGAAARGKTLRAVARLSGWLFREAQRPGQQVVLNASEQLRYDYVFPSDPVREAHLGYLLAWLQTRGSRDRRINAAQAAEKLAITTTMQPDLEREVLDPLVEQWNESSRSNPRTAARIANQIAGELKRELARRFELTVAGVSHLSSNGLRENAGVKDLVNFSLDEFDKQYLRLEYDLDDDEDGPAFVTSAETDRIPAAAASRYFVMQASESSRVAALLHDDKVLQEEAVVEGDAIRGKIIDVWDEGVGRQTIPVWVIKAEGAEAIRMREGSKVCVAGLQGRDGFIREISWSAASATVTVEITGLKTDKSSGGAPAANDKRRLVGTEILLLPVSFATFSRRKSWRAWSAKGPGDWLTRSRPSGWRVESIDDVSDEKELTLSEPG